MVAFVSKASCTCLLVVSIVICGVITLLGVTSSIKLTSYTAILHANITPNSTTSTIPTPKLKLNDTAISNPSHTDSINITSSSTTSPVNDSKPPILDKLRLLRAIQEIEFSIYLDEIHSIPEYNDSIFSTGLAPHYYDGPFSFQKTCKQMRFRYLCLPYIIEQYGFDQWTMLLHNNTVNETSLSNDTTNILSILQHHYDVYNHNIFHRLIQRINTRNKVFIKPNLNILMYGNSHLKQVILGFLCTLMSINSNAILQYIPSVIYCNETLQHSAFNFHDTFCLDATLIKIKESNVRQQNGLHLNESTMDAIYESQFSAHDICECSTEFLQLELMNHVNIYFIFANSQKGKSLYNQTLRFKKKYELELDLTSFDLILFNVGNGPPLDLMDTLDYDLRAMNHLNKPVIFHRAWYETYCRYLIEQSPQWLVDIEKVNDLRKRFPYLIYISTYRRYVRTKKVDLQMYYNLKESTIYGHFCNPGIPEHFAMSLLHLIDVLTTIVS